MEARLEKVRKHTLADEAKIHEQEVKLEDMKAIVARLTANNNDMLAILSTKVRLEESLKTVETANRKLLKVGRFCKLRSRFNVMQYPILPKLLTVYY